MKSEPVFAYAQLNARIQPKARTKRFEEPLDEELRRSMLGEVTGGGTMQQKSGEIEYCGIDIDLFDVEKGAEFVCEFLTNLGAPKGSKLLYEHHGRKVEKHFGMQAGIAIYLNGTDLPDEVYTECDVNVVIDMVDRLLGKEGAIRGYWQGPTETALYLYGKSLNGMREAIADFISEYPLCQRARIETIA